RKAGGILIESAVGKRESGVGSHFRGNDGRGAEWLWAGVGIGININQTEFEEFSTRAVSLKQITGKDWDAVELGKELCFNLDNRYQQLIAGNAKEQLKEYNSLLYKLNQSVRLKKENAVFETTIISVNRKG